MGIDKRLSISLFFIRITVFLVMFMWGLDKFLNPGHTAAIFQKFYSVPGLTDVVTYGLASLQMVLLFAFLLGIAKRWSYGLVMLFHAGSTIAPIAAYFTPYEGNHLLFFAAWPMLAAAVALFLLREKDTMLTFKGFGSSDSDTPSSEKGA